MSRVGSALTLGALVVTAATFMSGSAVAHKVPNPCDKVTSGGFVFDPNTRDGDHINFGVHGGCKDSGPDAPFWGGANVVDKGGFDPAGDPPFARPYHIKSTEITGYLCDPAFPRARDVCGWARTNAGETVRFRVRLVDNGEGTNAAVDASGNPCKDEFGIRLSNGYHVSTRKLAAGGPGGGTVQLHKPNEEGPFGNDSLCGGLGDPGNPEQGRCLPDEGDVACPES